METSGLLTEPAPQRSRAAPVAIAIALLLSIGCAAVVFSPRGSSSPLAAAITTSLSGVHFHFVDSGSDYGSLVGDDLIQKNWGGLTCARTDDDKWGWGVDDNHGQYNNNSVVNCVWGDTHFCTEHYNVTKEGIHNEMSDLLWQYCNTSCNVTDENAIEAQLVYDTTEANMKGQSMLAACAFGGIKDMRQVCADNSAWTSQFAQNRRAMAIDDPSTTRHFGRNDWHLQRRALSNWNRPPSVPYTEATYVYINGSGNTQYVQSACNTHGLCGICVSENGTINKYCEAFLQYYDVNQLFKEEAKRDYTYDAENFWYNVHFWCNETILDAIEDGTFKEKLVYGHIQDSMQVEFANTNEQEIKLWGTTNPPHYDSVTGHTKGDDN